MKRALPLALAAGLLASGTALADGPTIIGSLYVPDVDANTAGIGPQSASPDALNIEIRQPLNRNFWIGASLATAFGGDQIAPGVDVEIGNSLAINLGLAAEFAHHVEGYAYVGYGKAALDASGVGAQSVDGNGVAWGLGVDFQLNDHMLVDVGYASLFDDDMDGGNFQTSVSITGPRVGLGYRF